MTLIGNQWWLIDDGWRDVAASVQQHKRRSLCNLLSGGAECGPVPRKGRFRQTEGGAEEDGTAAVGERQRRRLRPAQVGLNHCVQSTVFPPTLNIFQAQLTQKTHLYSQKIYFLLGKLSKANSLLPKQQMLGSRRPDGAGRRPHRGARPGRPRCHPAPPVQPAAHRLPTEELHVHTE